METSTKNPTPTVGKKLQPYTIVVGDGKPKMGMMGRLNNGVVKDKKEIIIEGNPVFITSTSEAWGRKIIDSKGNYVGKIEWLEYGDPNGEEFQICYRKNAKSLDRHYQDVTMKLQALRDDEVSIELISGNKSFDRVIDATLIEYLQICHANRDSVSRRNTYGSKGSFGNYNPNTYVSSHEEMMKFELVSAKYLETMQESEEVVEIFAQIFNGKIDLVNIDLSSPHEIIKDQIYAKRNFIRDGVKTGQVEFCRILENFQKDFEDKYQAAKSAQIAKIEGSKFYFMNNGKWEVEMESVPSVSFFKTNLFYKKYFETHFKMITLLSKQ